MSAFPLRHWAKRTPLAWFLLPLVLVYWSITALRRTLYRRRLLRVEALPVPVVVVGNIHVGGVGKTPLTLYLAQALQKAGFTPGIISRGYGRTNSKVLCVERSSSAQDVGDEPLLLHLKSGCPVVVGADRAAAGRHLLRQHVSVDVILCDDGLQHYRLRRDIELCVLDGFRGWGNRWLLPAGPLREGLSRLSGVTALIVHGDVNTLPDLPRHKPRFAMYLAAAPIYRLQDPANEVHPSLLNGLQILALTGIGDPSRFFATLSALGLIFETRVFPDHHCFERADLVTDADVILMTEKDAVKCRELDDGKIHVLPVSARLDPDLGDWLINQLRHKNGHQTP